MPADPSPATPPAHEPDALLHALLPHVRAWLRPGQTLILGIVGPPGSGKSTLAAALLRALCADGALRGAHVSLDDFYLEPAQREARGFRFRGPPGTHDLALLGSFLRALADAGTAPEIAVPVPVFDRGRERRLPPRLVPGPLDLCIVEGWFVGARAPGYEPLADALHRLVYLDMTEPDARAARLRREHDLHAGGHAAMDAQTAAQFWAEALAPYLHRWVTPLLPRADLVLSIDGRHRLRGCTPGPATGAAPDAAPTGPGRDAAS